MYLPLATVGLALITLVITRGGVLDQFVGRKRNLAHRHVHQRSLVGTELDFAGLYFLYRLGRRQR